MNPFVGILIFSAVETAAVVVWAAILGLAANVSQDVQVTATVALFIGYVVEHIIAFNVGKGRGLFELPRP